MRVADSSVAFAIHLGRWKLILNEQVEVTLLQPLLEEKGAQK